MGKNCYTYLGYSYALPGMKEDSEEEKVKG
jgi:hypothetical protein